MLEGLWTFFSPISPPFAPIACLLLRFPRPLRDLFTNFSRSTGRSYLRGTADRRFSLSIVARCQSLRFLPSEFYIVLHDIVVTVINNYKVTVAILRRFKIHSGQDVLPTVFPKTIRRGRSLENIMIRLNVLILVSFSLLFPHNLIHIVRYDKLCSFVNIYSSSLTIH